MKIFFCTTFFLSAIFTGFSQAPEIVLPEGHHSPLNNGVFSPDSKLVITSADDGSVMLWSTITGRVVKNFTNDKYVPYDLKFSNDGKRLFLLKSNGIEILKTEDLSLMDSISSNGQQLYSMSISKDGNWLTCISNEFVARVLNIQTKQWIHSFQQKGKLILQDVDFSGNLLETFEGKITQIAITPDGKMVITGTEQGDCRFWNIALGKMTDSCNVGSAISKIVISPGGRAVGLLAGMHPYIYDIATKRLTKINGHGFQLSDATFSKDEKLMATSAADGNAAIIWDVNTGKEKSSFTDWSSYLLHIVSINFNLPATNLATSGPYYNAYVWDIAKKKALVILKGHKGDITSVQYSPDGRYILTTSKDFSAKLWDAGRGKLIYTLQAHNHPADLIAISSTNEIFAAVSPAKGSATIWDIKKGIILNTFKINSWCASYFSISIVNNNQHLFISECEDMYTLYDLKTGKQIEYNTDSLPYYQNVNKVPDKYRVWEYGENDKIEIWDDTARHSILDLTRYENFGGLKYRLTRDNTKGLFFTNTGPKVYDLESGQLLYSIGKNFNYASLTDNDQYIIAATGRGTITMFNTATGKPVHTLDSHKGNIIQAFFIQEENKLVSTSTDGTIKYWNVGSGKLIATYIPIDSADFMVLLPNNIYMASKKASKLISFRIGAKIFSFDQFDIQFNRPHEVLKALGCTDIELIETYKKAYEKRLKKEGISETSGVIGLNAPDIAIINGDKLALTTESPGILLKIKASGSNASLKNYQAYVNDVPVNGAAGFVVKGNRMLLDTSVSINLSAGFNKIQLSCTNNLGVESSRASLFINFEPDRQPVSKIYFIGIGVNEYTDSTMNLHYAAKDIRDLCQIFASRSKNTIIDTLINLGATRNNILKLRSLLQSTSVEDKVIMSVSGHGLLSENLDFYFANTDIDFNQPEKNGLLYEELENLLDNIPARKKLLLIDACHSGELDKEEEKMTASPDSSVIVKAFNTRGVKINSSFTASKQNSFELMKLLFSDLNKGNGTVVISAAGGKEYALEDKTWDNGVFTFCTKKAILEGLADTDKNGVTVNELNDFLRKAVEQYTNGRQRPTTRREVTENDWLIF